jgi:hypothetical protein
LTFLSAPLVGQNLPTPWIGLWERINIAVFLVWVIALSMRLWPRAEAADESARIRLRRAYIE